LENSFLLGVSSLEDTSVPEECRHFPKRADLMAKNMVVATEDDFERQFKEDRKSAVQVFESEYREHIWRYIKSICRYFSEDDIHDVYQQSLGEFIRCAQKPDFDPHRPLRLIQHIAGLRAIDRLRRKKDSRTRNAGDLIDVLARNLSNSRVNWECKLAVVEEWPRFHLALDKAVDELPPKQRTAALAYLEVYEVVDEEKSYRALAERVREITGEECSTVQAYANWQAARKSIAAKLRHEQFHLLIEE
jgi:DNA-directed RNA polymerase specialized sigma24 family protein